MEGTRPQRGRAPAHQPCQSTMERGTGSREHRAHHRGDSPHGAPLAGRALGTRSARLLLHTANRAVGLVGGPGCVACVDRLPPGPVARGCGRRSAAVAGGMGGGGPLGRDSRLSGGRAGDCQRVLPGRGSGRGLWPGVWLEDAHGPRACRDPRVGTLAGAALGDGLVARRRPDRDRQPTRRREAVSIGRVRGDVPRRGRGWQPGGCNGPTSTSWGC